MMSVSGGPPLAHERRALDVYVHGGSRLGFAVELPDQLYRQGGAWLAFLLPLDETECRALGAYATARAAFGAIVAETTEVER